MQEINEYIIQKNISLKNKNTFGVDAKAAYYVSISDENQLRKFLKSNKSSGLQLFVLGGGSNILFTADYEGLVIHPEIKGISVISEDKSGCRLAVAAGENWDELVSHCIRHKFYGLENLSFIPGSVGAAPIQNIGAYGVEVSDSIHEVHGIELDTLEKITLTSKQCQFGYRDSIFKRAMKNRVVITNVIFRLRKKPDFKLDYGNLKEEVGLLGGVNPLNVRQAVINIRNSKLPDPAKLGNAGSFFKNPVISPGLFKKIKESFSDAPGFIISDKSVKVPAGWLIEKCGWKGKRSGNAGVHDKQALIIVNHGNATGEEIFNLSEKIVSSVQEAFGITLEKEVNIL